MAPSLLRLVTSAMRTYRILTSEGLELTTVLADSVIEVIATSLASVAPLGARIVQLEGSRVLARRELWTGGFPGWSLVAIQAT
jgi:hypothetical protein